MMLQVENTTTVRQFRLAELPTWLSSRIEADAHGCWIWQGSRNWKDYGRVSVAAGMRHTHRVFYELLVGPIPDGLVIDHLCRVRACCNPAHLEPVTNKVNCNRSAHATKTHCIHGHELSGANLRISQDRPGVTRRRCRTCDEVRTRKYNAKRRIGRSA